MTVDCGGYGTLFLTAMPLASWCRKVSLCRGKLRIAQRAAQLLFLNVLYDWSHVRVRALERHSAI
jgi:hypothetical protein